MSTAEQAGVTCVCGETKGVRPYAGGPACPAHTPAARAGNPEPDSQRYCAPLRCYCGRDMCEAVVGPVEPVIETVVDIRAVASGKRRSTLAEYRNAQAAQ